MLKKFIAVTILLIMFFSFSVFGTDGTSDWAKSEIDEALALNLVPTDLQNNYTSYITRSEFTHIAVSFLHTVKHEDLSVVQNYFNDTTDPYVNRAYKLGIIDGRGDGTFAPNDSITRQEAAKIVANTYRIYADNNVFVANDLDFGDASEIADWAYEDIGVLCRMGIMQGTGKNFEPLGLYTREQSIVTFLRLFKFIQKLSEEPSMNGKNPKITDFLEVKNGRLASGNDEIVLNGLNLGGWLLVESWMSPVYDKYEEMAYSDIINTLEKRFGKVKTNALINLYEDSFITENDFEYIEKLGFNCVRIPFWYRNFMNTDGTFLDDKNEDNPGFKRLDWIIEQCEMRGIWVILDMHGCPGGQSMNHSTGIIGVNGLYENETNLSRMESLWTEIAMRYKDKKCIAAYDIMNEPQNNSGYSKPRAWQPESKKAVELTNKVYDRMIKAIRKVDKNHCITVEGIWTIDVLPNPEKYGWDNMIYQLHIYDTEKTMIDKRVSELLNAQKEYGVAVLVGEYNSNTLEEYAWDLYDKYKISRIKWTYKVVGNHGDWGLFGKAYNKINIKTASYEEIQHALGTDMLTENGFVINTREYNLIT